MQNSSHSIGSANMFRNFPNWSLFNVFLFRFVEGYGDTFCCVFFSIVIWTILFSKEKKLEKFLRYWSMKMWISLLFNVFTIIPKAIFIPISKTKNVYNLKIPLWCWKTKKKKRKPVGSYQSNRLNQMTV